MRIDKPGPKKKRKQEDTEYLNARDFPCVECWILDGTTVACHYTGPLQHKFGKAMGKKGLHRKTAFLCHKCHADADQYKEYKGIMTDAEKWIQSDKFEEWIRRTDILREEYLFKQR